MTDQTDYGVASQIALALAIVGLILWFAFTRTTAQERCEAEGGRWLFSHVEEYTWTQWVQVGEVKVPINHKGERDVYECVGTR